MSSPYLVPDPNAKPESPKRLLLRSAGIGAGFAVALCLIVGGWVWYSNRPSPPKPWNTTALIAPDPPGFHVSDDGKHVEFTYRVENTTETDYQIAPDSRTRLMFRGKNGVLSQPLPSGLLPDVLELPIFIPAKQKAVLRIILPLSSFEERSASESDAQYHERLRAYCENHFEKLGAFVLFDEQNRFEINLPRWSPEPHKKP
jgi:hypothetical protein